MPQIDQIADVYASQLFWLVIFFGAIFVIVGLGMLPKIQATIDARDDKIAADLKAADEARTAADALEEVYRSGIDKGRTEANKLSADAKADAMRNTEKAIAKADKAIAAKVEKATSKIADARAAARSEIEGVAAEATKAMVERVAGLEIDAAAARAAVAKELANG
ncbi:MAG TPA: ATPase [Sphingomicrobium sp.]|nr:ATPase [Sphingomicrobium sp.]